MQATREYVQLGLFFGLIPLVKICTTKELEDSLTDAGFEIDHQWRPDKVKAVFIVAQKAEETQ